MPEHVLVLHGVAVTVAYGQPRVHEDAQPPLVRCKTAGALQQLQGKRVFPRAVGLVAAEVEGIGRAVETTERLEVAREPVEQRALSRLERPLHGPQPVRHGAFVGEEPPEQLRVHAVRPVFEPRGGELRVQGVTALVIEGEGRLVAAVYEFGGPGALRHVHAEPRKERRDEFGVRPLAPGLYF